MSLSESNVLELKEKVTTSFLRTVSAFANQDGGHVIFGIDDNGTVRGLDDVRQEALRVENMINDALDPVPPFSLSRDDTLGTLDLLVEEGPDKPYFCSGKAYRRVDTSTVAIDRTSLERLVEQGSGRAFDEMRAPEQDCSFSVLEEEMQREVGISSLSRDVQRTFGLYRDGVGFTRAGLLLADSNPYPGISLVRTTDDTEVIKSRHDIDGVSLVTCFREAMDAYRDEYQIEAVEGERRITTALIPEAAFREAIANALVHRDWHMRGRIKMTMSPHRIEIVSPGGLPSNMTKGDYLDGDLSEPRNPVIATVFFRLGMIEGLGTGVRRIRRAYEGKPVAPQFEVRDSSIKVMLPIATLADAASEDILAVFEDGLAHTRRELQERLGMSQASAARTLSSFVERGVLRKLGNGPSTRYVVP